MAKSISEEELQLKKRARRRLIGAIALVTMVVVFLPMVLDHEPRPVSQDINVQIPSPNSATYTSKIVPVVPGAPGPGGKTIVIEPEPSSPAVAAAPATAPTKSEARPQTPPPDYDSEAAPAPAKKAAEKAAPPKTQPVAPPPVVAVAKPVAPSAPPAQAAPPAPAEAKATGGFVVQVAALNDVGKAKEMQGKMLASGMKAYTEVVPTAKGSVTRVRAGPFATREEAEKTRDKLKDMGLAGNIVPK